MNLKRISRSDHCLNCGHSLNIEKDNFCPACGQLNNTKKESVGLLLRELVEEFLHLDSKVMRSLVPLLFRPGLITRDYISGHRARYFHPVRMFLTLTIVFFIVQGLTSEEKEKRNVKDGSGNERTLVYDTESGDINYENADSLKELGVNIKWSFGDVIVHKDTLQSYLDRGIDEPIALMDTFGIEKSMINKIFFRQIVKAQKGGFDKMSDYFRYRLHWILFSLMPVFAFVLYLFYFRKKIFFVDHLVFAFYLHSGIFLIFSIVFLLSDFILKDLDFLSIFVPVYYYSSIKNVYGQSWFWTILKGTGIGIFYFIFGLIASLMVAAILLLMQ